MPRMFDEPLSDPATDLDTQHECATCGRELWWDGLDPVLDGSRWICGDCDLARNFTALDLG